MGYPGDCGDGEHDRELRAKLDDIWCHYRAVAAELAADHRRLRASWQHHQTIGSVLGIVLMKARSGVLERGWRERLSVDFLYTRRPRPDDQALRDAEDLAVYEVAMTPPSEWEPYAANGDWRRGLAAWYTATQELTRHQYRTRQWLTDLGNTSEADRRTSARLNAALESRERDAIEASYRAGLAAGGDTQDWRGWYRARILDTWSAADDAARGLYHSVERMLAQLDSAEPVVIGADLITIHQHLPDYWRSAPA